MDAISSGFLIVTNDACIFIELVERLEQGKIVKYKLLEILPFLGQNLLKIIVMKSFTQCAKYMRSK
jgi:hypothetical protein